MMNKRIFALIMTGMLLTACSQGNNANNVKTENNVQKIEEQLKNDNQDDMAEGIQYLTKEEALEDFDYFYEAYKNNNLSIRSEELNEEFDQIFKKHRESIVDDITVEELYLKLSEIANITNDGHASIKYKDMFTIPIKVDWLSDSLVVIGGECEELQNGDEILEINGKKPEDILNDIDNIISNENIYGLKFSATRKLNQKSALDYLGCISEDGKVHMKIQTIDGNVKDVKLDFNKNNKVMKANTQGNGGNNKPEGGGRKSNLSYKIIDDNSAMLEIPSSFYDEEAESVLNEFFSSVKEKNIDKIVVDLRKNTGGTTAIIDAFLKYIDVDEVQYWKNDRIDFGIKTFEHNPDLVYNGEIFVATSKGTLSAATMFTTTLKYNNIATVIGEPSGQAGLFYGGVKDETLPNSNMKFGVTRLKVYLQDDTYPEVIEPDVPILLTKEDLITGRDPVIEWVKEQ